MPTPACSSSHGENRRCTTALKMMMAMMAMATRAMNANMVIVLRWCRSGFADTSRLPPLAARANRGQPRFNPEIQPARIRVNPGPGHSADSGHLAARWLLSARVLSGRCGLLGFVVLDGVADVCEDVGTHAVAPLAVVPSGQDSTLPCLTSLSSRATSATRQAPAFPPRSGVGGSGHSNQCTHVCTRASPDMQA